MRYRNTLRNSRTRIWGIGTLLVVPELEYEYIPELEWNTFCWEISYLSLHLKCFEQMSVGLEQGELMNQLQNLERICGQVEPEDQDGFRRRIKDGVKKMDRSFAKTGSIFRCKKYSFFKGKRNSLLIMYLPFFWGESFSFTKSPRIYKCFTVSWFTWYWRDNCLASVHLPCNIENYLIL